jgi:Na+-transporting NADH:ubiquinone oxidoreductase subunit NqrB
LWLVCLAVVITIGSKFLIRYRGKHIFNPTNFGIVCLLILSDGAWVSPGQWGSIVWFAFPLVCLGSMVVYRSTRSDISLAFLAAYSLMLGAPGPVGWVIHSTSPFTSCRMAGC